MRVSFEKGTRYYSLEIDRDFFDWVVFKQFGGMGMKNGHRCSVPFDNYPSAKKYFDAECARRLKRGYTESV